MTSDLHPHWKSTDNGSVPPVPPPDDREFWPMGGDAPLAGEENVVHHRVSIGTQGTSASLLLFLLVAVALPSFGVVFLRGVNRIRADLTEEIAPALTIAIRDEGFAPASGSIEAGKRIAWKNEGSTNQQLRSDQLSDAGVPVVSSPLLPPGGTFAFAVPLELGGGVLTVRSALVPTMTSTITVEAPTETVPPPETAPPVPVVTMPTSSSAPSVPSPPPAPSPSSPVIHIGSTDTPVAAAWPSLLRTNRFTVGSAAIPAPSPIHTAWETYEQWREPAHSAPPARKQPETGPALWIVSLLTLCVIPVLFRRKRKNIVS